MLPQLFEPILEVSEKMDKEKIETLEAERLEILEKVLGPEVEVVTLLCRLCEAIRGKNLSDDEAVSLVLDATDDVIASVKRNLDKWNAPTVTDWLENRSRAVKKIAETTTSITEASKKTIASVDSLDGLNDELADALGISNSPNEMSDILRRWSGAICEAAVDRAILRFRLMELESASKELGSIVPQSI
jgi:hypothetical protein